jgi:ElaB/YqjD/DUF883 family membrane-anchored ribosome-binding protein
MMNATTDNGVFGNRSDRSGGSNRSAADLEREGEQIRADLDRTLDEIERKLSPGELLDRSVEYLRDNGGEFLAEAGATVRSNPVPVLLTAAGLLWLTTSIVKSRSTTGREAADAHTGGVRQDANELARAATGKLSSSMHAAKDRTRDVMHSVQNRTQAARSDFAQLVQEQPVALGAVALAVGALLGAAFPITPYEERVVGPVRDRTMARAKEVGERSYENLREAVTSSFKDGSGGGRSTGARSATQGNSPQGAPGEFSDQAPVQG